MTVTGAETSHVLTVITSKGNQDLRKNSNSCVVHHMSSCGTSYDVSYLHWTPTVSDALGKSSKNLLMVRDSSNLNV